jgi:hypothetical protein
MSRDFDIFDIEGTFDKIVIMNCSFELIRCYGKISILHLTSERFAQRLVETLGTIDVPLIARHKQRGEERDALDVIPMRVTDEDMTPLAFGAGRHQILTERMSSSPTINDNKCPKRRANLDAGGVPPIACRGRARLSYRTASSPELYPHVASTHPAMGSSTDTRPCSPIRIGTAKQSSTPSNISLETAKRSKRNNDVPGPCTPTN